MAYLTAEQLAAMGFRRLGKGVRVSDKASIHDADRIEIWDHSRVDDFCVVSGRVVIGRNVHLAVFCNVAGGERGVEIGDFSVFAYGCHVFSQSDDYSGATMTNSTVPERYKKVTRAAVRVGRHCIVGTNSLIFPGVALAEGTSVGAMTMVTHPTPRS